MKKLILVICIGILSKNINAQFSKSTLQANGLTCAMCSNAVNKALQKLPFVESVKADIKNTAFNITFKPAANVDIDDIKTAVEDAGFSVGKLTLTGTFNKLQAANDEHVKIGKDNFHFLNIKDQVLDGEQTLTVLDKSFVTNKEFKTVKSYSKKKCVETGKADSCCDDAKLSSRMYHVTI